MLTTSYSLLERLRQSDLDSPAWDRFVALYTPLLHYWARRWGLQATDASDVIQDVLVVLLRELPSYQRHPNTRFRSWLWSVTRNRVRTLRRQRFPGAASNDLSVDELVAPDHVAEQEAAEELTLLTRRAAELLQNDFQPATWKAFWETAVVGRSGLDVGHELGMTVGAVYAARFRVQQRIREELAGFLD
jgi:RNA polymerase sigma-70 factor (ECF subfamily)